MKKLALIVLFLAASLSSWAVGQKYITDNFHGNPTRLYEPTAERGCDKVLGCNPDKYIEVPAGEELILHSDKWHAVGYDYAYVLYNGKEYAVRCRDIRFVEDNAAGEGNVLQDGVQCLIHSKWGDWYGTYSPFICILILALIIGVISFLLRVIRSKFVVVLLMLIMGTLLIGLTALEAGALACLDSGTRLWWINAENIGYFRTILILVGMVLVFALQFIGGSRIRECVVDLKNEYVTFKLFFLTLVPVFILFVTVLVMGLCHVDNAVIDHVGNIVAISLYGALLLFFWIMNRGAGFIGGLLYSIFGMVYAVGATLVVIYAGIVIVKLIVQMLIAIGTVVFCLYIAMKFGPKGGGGYTDVRGGYHDTKDAKDFANQQIYDAERKKNESE